MWFLLIAIISIGLSAAAFIFLKDFSGYLTGILIAVFLILGGILVIKSITIIDAGEVGVVVLFGKANNQILDNGFHSINPMARAVRYPVRLREYNAKEQEAIEVRSNDGLRVSMEVSILYNVDKEKVVEIYKSIAKDIGNLENRIFTPIVRSVIRNISANFNTYEIYSSQREKLTEQIKNQIIQELSSKGTHIDSVMIRKIVLPNQVDQAIQLKLAAQQEAEAMNYKKDKAEKEAEIKIVEAEGLAKAQKIINSTLSPMYLQHEAIQAYLSLAESPNSTFVIMPTSPDGAGIPLILNSR